MKYIVKLILFLLANANKYAVSLLTRAPMADAKPYSTKMAVSDRLKKDTGELFTDPTTYRSIITSILNYSEVIALTEDQFNKC